MAVLFAIYIQFCRMLLILLACCSVLLVLGNRLLAIWQDSTVLLKLTVKN